MSFRFIPEKGAIFIASLCLHFTLGSRADVLPLTVAIASECLLLLHFQYNKLHFYINL